VHNSKKIEPIFTPATQRTKRTSLVTLFPFAQKLLALIR